MIYLTSSSQREVKDVLQVSSFPLSWVNPHFLLTGENNLADVCGVLLGNSVFIAVVIQACYQPIRWLFRRSRTTQLSLSQASSENQDDECASVPNIGPQARGGASWGFVRISVGYYDVGGFPTSSQPSHSLDRE